MVSDLLVATALALLFLALSWSWGRATGAGKPLNRFKRTLLAYSFVFVLGMSYMMAFGAELRWPKILLFSAIACWGAALAGVAWLRHRTRPTIPP